MVTGITEIAIVILVAAVLGIFAKMLKQPPILAYLAAGIVIGYFGFFHFDNIETFRLFADMGIMFLLFLVGLEINYTSLRLVGKTSLVVGLGQLMFTALFGFLLSSLLGFSTVPAVYIAIALTFSSTIIVVQLLTSKKALNSLYGKLSMGIFLVQDFVAILILVSLAGIQMSGGINVFDIGIIVLESIVLFGIMLFLGRRLFPYLFHKIAHSHELLFLSSLAWLFSVAAIVEHIGFSIEIGGFLAGLALANSSEHFEISSRVRPLRDFFLLVFFAILGSSMVFSNIGSIIVPALILSLFVLIGNPLIVIILMSALGYKKRVSFMSGITIAQISEFGLIITATGLRLEHISNEVVAIVTTVAAVTITISTYFILYSEKIFRFLSPYLEIFEKEDVKEVFMPAEDLDKPIVLIGHHRTGQSIAAELDKDDLLIIDFDPEVVEDLKKRDYATIFGDISDFEIFDKINFENSRIIISTNPNLNDNMTLLSELKRVAKIFEREDRPKIILRAENRKEAEILYKNGADYVLIPQLISGHYLGRVLSGDGNLDILDQLRDRDVEFMKDDDKISNSG